LLAVRSIAETMMQIKYYTAMKILLVFRNITQIKILKWYFFLLLYTSRVYVETYVALFCECNVRFLPKTVASSAIGHWGTCPLDFHQFHF